MAVSDKSEKSTMYLMESGAHNTLNKGHSGTKNKIDIDTITLNDYFRHLPIKPVFIKMDAEGYELNILKGMTDILNLNKITIMIESGAVKLAKKYHNINSLESLKFLGNLGFKFRDLNANDGFLDYKLIEEKYKNCNSIRNFVCIKQYEISS